MENKPIATENMKTTAEVSSKWYVLRVINTKEKKAKEFLEMELEDSEWKEWVKQVFLPTEKVYKIQRGKKIVQELNYYPGYLMIEILGSYIPDELKELVRQTQFIIHFLGKDIPTPLSRHDVAKMLGKQEEMMQQIGEGPSMKNPFLVGETVKIIEGPFNDFHGEIEEVSLDKKKLKVVVKIFGRSTPVDLSFMQVERVIR